MDREMNKLENVVNESKFESNSIHADVKGNSEQPLLARLTHEFFVSQRQINQLILQKIKSLEEKIANIGRFPMSGSHESIVVTEE